MKEDYAGKEKSRVEYIEKVKLNYDFYSGDDLYSDGDEIEEELLGICKSGKIEEALAAGDKWPVLYHLSDIRGNLIDWYPFDAGASVLEIGCGCGAVSGFLCRKVRRVVGIELSKRRCEINAYRNRECDNLEIIVGNFKDIELEEKFDYVTLIGVLEYSGSYISGKTPYIDMIKRVQSFLKPGGKIIIAIENKMGMKYLNGANEDHLGKRFKGIENYRGVNTVRTFSKQELTGLLNNCGITEYSFYYPVPDYKLPHTVYSSRYLPERGDIRTWETNYDMRRLALYNEAIAADQFCKDGIFDYFSNSFLLICNEADCGVDFAHYTRIRKPCYQTQTLICRRNGERYIEKKMLKAGEFFLKRMETYHAALNEEFSELEYLRPQCHEDVLTYPYIQGKRQDKIIAEDLENPDKMVESFILSVKKIFSHAAKTEREFAVTDEYMEYFGGNIVRTEEKSLLLTNLDLLFSNVIVSADKTYCIDYEWVVDFPVPIEFVIYRAARYFWFDYGMYMSHKYNYKGFITAVGVKEENVPVYDCMEHEFIEYTTGKYNYIKHYAKERASLEQLLKVYSWVL